MRLPQVSMRLPQGLNTLGFLEQSDNAACVSGSEHSLFLTRIGTSSLITRSLATASLGAAVVASAIAVSLISTILSKK